MRYARPDTALVPLSSSQHFAHSGHSALRCYQRVGHSAGATSLAGSRSRLGWHCSLEQEAGGCVQTLPVVAKRYRDRRQLLTNFDRPPDGAQRTQALIHHQWPTAAAVQSLPVRQAVSPATLSGERAWHLGNAAYYGFQAARGAAQEPLRCSPSCGRGNNHRARNLPV